MHPLGKLPQLCLTLGSALTLAFLTACGGSSDGGTPTPAPSPTPTPAVVTISGIAATGAPIALGNITVICQNNVRAAALTLASGAYTLEVAASALPCAIRVVPAGGGQALYAVTIGSTSPVSGNLTPLTTLATALAVNSGAAQSLDSWFASPTSLPSISAGLAAAQTRLQAALQAAGYKTPTPFEPFTAVFSPTPGDGYDDLLEALGAGLKASGGSLATALTAFVNGTALPAPVATGGNTAGNTVTASLNASLVKSYSLAFYADGAGCGSACSFTDGMDVPVTLGAGGSLNIAGKTLSNPYNRILKGATAPHTPEIIWRDGNIEYALTNNDTGVFNEINIGDISAPTADGLPKFIGQIRAVQASGTGLVTQFAGTYTKATQYHGPANAATWTSVTIRADGAIIFDGGDSTGLGPTISASNISAINDFTSCCGSVQILTNVDLNSDRVVDNLDSIRLFRNAAGELSGLEYYLNANNHVGVLLGAPAALPAHSGAAIPATNQMAGTANGTAYPMDIESGGAYSHPGQGGFSLNASAGGTQSWRLAANREGALAVNTVFSCQENNDGRNNRQVTLTFRAAGNEYRSTEGGRCQVTLTNVTFDGNGAVTSVEGRFVAELHTFKRNLAPLVINDGVFRWVRP
jgi:hypothetical protein